MRTRDRKGTLWLVSWQRDDYQWDELIKTFTSSSCKRTTRTEEGRQRTPFRIAANSCKISGNFSVQHGYQSTVCTRQRDTSEVSLQKEKNNAISIGTVGIDHSRRRACQHSYAFQLRFLKKLSRKSSYIRKIFACRNIAYSKKETEKLGKEADRFLLSFRVSCQIGN